MSFPLNERAEVLLKTLVERYIDEGQPVGSRALARYSRLDLSPATIRNVMADLEELGLVASPHTSAGRMPTQLGYRVFVDSLLKVRPLDGKAITRLKAELKLEADPHQIVGAASQILSEVSHLAGIVMAPRRDEAAAFRHIDFLNLSGRRILVILVTEDGAVQNRIIQVERDYSTSELEQAANYFNDEYAGIPYRRVREKLLRTMQQESESMQRIMRLAVQMAQQAFSDDDSCDLLVSGESNLMDFPDLSDMRKLRRLFDAFTTKRDLMQLLDQCMRADGIKIFIGSESGYEPLEDCSVVTAPYHVDGHIVGTLGVIGPTRMAYETVIPIVDLTSRLLSAALSVPDGNALESPKQ